MPCTCAAKRDIDVDDLPKTAVRNLTHRRVQSHGAKPLMTNRRSDSSVPRPPVGAVHPPLPRLNNAAHELGMPYTVPRFATSTPNINILPHVSDEALPLGSQGPTSQPSMPTEVPSSVPRSGWMPQSSSVDLGAPQRFSSADYLQPRVDTSFMNNALSPGNPMRYSMNDFSNFKWPNQGSGGPIYGQSNFAVSAEALGSSAYSDWGLDTPSYSQSNTTLHTPQRLSVASIDQPPLTHSPSNTVSEAGSSAFPSDHGYTNFVSQPPSTVNPSYTSKDYFGSSQGLDTVSESLADTPGGESFAYRLDSDGSVDDFFGSGPGPAEPVIKSEPVDFTMNEALPVADPFTATETGPSLVVPEFNNSTTASFSYTSRPFSGPTTAVQPVQQPQFYEQPMGGSFIWEFAQDNGNTAS